MVLSNLVSRDIQISYIYSIVMEDEDLWEQLWITPHHDEAKQMV